MGLIRDTRGAGGLVRRASRAQTHAPSTQGEGLVLPGPGNMHRRNAHMCFAGGVVEGFRVSGGNGGGGGRTQMGDGDWGGSIEGPHQPRLLAFRAPPPHLGGIPEAKASQP